MTLLDQRLIRPMLAKPGEPFDSEDYIFELKWDGLRTLLYIEEGHLELQNRNLRDVTASYPELQGLVRKIRAKTAILDGEVVVLGRDGRPDFGRLQSRFGIDESKRADVLSRTTPVTYVAFDLLHLNGRDLIKEPLEERKKQLKSILREGPHLLYGDHVETHGLRFFREASKKGFEGIIAKERFSAYLLGVRGSSWIKIKGSKSMDCVVVGFTQGEGSRASTFGSLVVAAFDGKGQLHHLGNVGGGLDNPSLENIKRKLARLRRKTPMISGPVEAPSPITWVKPSLVCEVLYTNITSDGKLRFPRFRRLRADKTLGECRLES